MADWGQHISDDLAAQYADDPESVPDRKGMDRHLAVCGACFARVETFREFVTALRDGETWWLAEELTEGSGRHRIREFVERCAAEDANAEEMLRPVLSSHYRFSAAKIARKRRFQTGGVVRLLCKTAWEECAREPIFALSLAESAVVIAEGLSDDYYPGRAVNELRGTAWKEASTAYRLVGQLDAAFDALASAERAYQCLPDFEIQMATVNLCRAILHWEREQHDEALRYARAAAATFAQRDEDHRYFEAVGCEAIILQSVGNTAAARERCERVFEFATTSGDPEMKARAANNLATAHRDAGDMALASHYFAIALQLYDGLGLGAMVAQTRWSVARLSLLAGNAAEAARLLPAIVDELRRFGMMNYAAHARLDLAEAYLILDRFDEVEAVCTDLVEFYRKAAIVTGALTAASFLKEVTKRRAATRRHFEHVRRYLSALERSPELLFAPPESD